MARITLAEQMAMALPDALTKQVTVEARVVAQQIDIKHISYERWGRRSKKEGKLYDATCILKCSRCGDRTTGTFDTMDPLLSRITCACTSRLLGAVLAWTEAKIAQAYFVEPIVHDVNIVKLVSKTDGRQRYNATEPMTMVELVAFYKKQITYCREIISK